MNIIKNHRERAGFTQGDLAEKINVDRSTVAKWETGVAFPRTSKLIKLAAIFDCTIDELCGCATGADER